jgi:transposase, IS5 family
MMQPSFFDTENRLKKLDEKDNLLKLNRLINWELFRPTLESARNKSDRKSNAGRKPYDAVIPYWG